MIDPDPSSPRADPPEFTSNPHRLESEPKRSGSANELPELRRRVAELEAQNAHLMEAVAARDALLAVAGHELRNPITPILGRVELMKRMIGSPNFEVEKLQKGLEQIEWLIGQYMKRATILLDVSRITSGRLELNRSSIDVSNLVQQVVENFRPIADRAGCDLTIDLPDGVLLASGDMLALEEILDNLVSNAIKYAGGAPVIVHAARDIAADCVRIEVRDSGPGIPQADQERIFERFERAVEPRERNGGFGVGLWIVRQLTEAMGGKIGVHSGTGAGSTFCVTLPAWCSKDGK
jgi:two-component system, OmpR family, sensor kinase